MFKKEFEILGIPPTSDGRVIRAAYVRLARTYHPDRSPSSRPPSPTRPSAA
jgi:curved DNA-binding protein CbpA